MLTYVLGFAFDSNMRLVLIKKDRPEGMAGKWNGIGGKVEEGETPINAMTREFAEETGVHSPAEVWQHFATLTNKLAGFTMVCFVTVWKPEDLDLVRTVETEEVRIFDGDVLVQPDLPLMANLRWLVPMSLCLGENEIPANIEFGYNG
jgi:8-oxo-dGTP diphosphatase